MKRHVTVFAAAAIVGALCTATATPLSAADGEKVFNKCKACHALEAGKHKVGPSLAGVVGRQAGTAEGFGKYKGLEGADWVWDEAALSGYLEDPKGFVKAKNGKRTSMVLKLRKEEDRKAVIEFLKQH